MIVTCNHQTLDLSIPKDADAFLMAMNSYGEAAKCEWGKEYDFAERTLSRDAYDHISDATHRRLRSGGF